MNGRPHVQSFSRRGVCPALSAPMQTGDGLLSRIALEGDVSPDMLGQLCKLAILHGNGLVDITARGSFQFRGLSDDSAAALERDVLALRLPLRRGLAVECSPLSGIDTTEVSDARHIVQTIREEAAATGLERKLAAKMSVIVDGGGTIQLSDLIADIRLKAVRANGETLWQLMLGGTEEKALYAGCLRDADAAKAVLALLRHLADLGDGARGRDLGIASVSAICGDRLVVGVRHEGSVQTSLPYGVLALNEDLCAAGVAPAFGQVAAEAIISVCRKAGELGMGPLRLGPAHSLLFPGNRLACQSLLAFAQAQGFVTAPGDPRSAIAVCPGSPACASAFAPVQEIAAFAALECGSLLDGSFTLHLSGCGKGCAHPSRSLLAFSGSSEGMAFGYSTTVSAAPDHVLPFIAQKAALSRLARLYEKEHKPGENAHALLSRLGKAAVVEALRQDER